MNEMEERKNNSSLLFEKNSIYEKNTFDSYESKLNISSKVSQRGASAVSGKLKINGESKTEPAAVKKKKQAIMLQNKEREPEVERLQSEELFVMPFATSQKKTSGQAEISEQNSGLVYEKRDKYGDRLARKKVRRETAVSKTAEKLEKNDKRLSGVLSAKNGEILSPDEKDSRIKKIRTKAAKDNANLNSRLKFYSDAGQTIKSGIDEQADIKEKETAFEAAEKFNKATAKLRNDIVKEVFKPDSQKRLEKYDRLERRQHRYEKRYDNKYKKSVMSSFFSNVHENEAAVRYGLTGDKSARESILKTQSERIRIFDAENNSIVRETARNKYLIKKQMQKKSNQRKYAKAIRNNILNDQNAAVRNSMSIQQSAFVQRVRKGIKKKANKLKKKLFSIACGCLLSLMSGTALFVIAGALIFNLAVNFISGTSYQSDWTNITEITDYFTKKETLLFLDIKDINTDNYDDVTLKLNGIGLTDLNGDGKTDTNDLLYAVLAHGQCDQRKYVSFIASLKADFTLENTKEYLDEIFNRVYAYETDTDDIWDWDEDGNWSPTDEEELIVELTIRDIEEVIEEIINEALPENQREDVKNRYHTYQITRGGQTSLANPVAYDWTVNGLSAQMGYRIIEKNGEYVEEYHNGLDIATRFITPVFTSKACTIKEIGVNDSRNFVVMQTDDGLIIRYAYLQDIDVNVNNIKKRHRRIGTSTENIIHVDVQIKGDDDEYHYINPLFIFSSYFSYD